MSDAIASVVAQTTVGTPLSEAYQAIKHALLGFKADVVSLERTRTTIEAALLDADSMVEQCSHAQQDMLEKLRCELDALIGFFLVREAKAMRREAMGGSWLMKETRLFFSPSNQVVARFLDARKVKDMRNKLDAIARDNAQFGSIVSVPAVNRTQVSTVRTAASQIFSSVLVGRDNDRDSVIRSITSDTGEDNAQVISTKLSVTSIAGIGGIGKTALAWNVCNDDRVKSSFEVQFWVDVTDDFDVADILKKIITSAMNEHPFAYEIQYNVQNLYHHFIRAVGGKKFLLVLDNIWEVQGLKLKWMDLRSLLEEGAYGSKVLITTRNQNVSRIMDSDNPHLLMDLAEEDTWSLFQHIAFTRWHEPGVETIGREIVKMCPNVPLVIRSIGSLLAGKHTVQEWEAFRDDQFANFSSYGRDVMQTLKLSYDRLDARLKLCVNYCTLISKGIDFMKDEMIHRWIGLGYVKPFYWSQSLEDAGEEYMIILLNSGFLKPSMHYAAMIAFKMHDIMYDLVLSLAGPQYKVANSYTDDEFDQKIHHMSYHFGNRSSPLFSKQHITSLFKIKQLQSLSIVFAQPRYEKVIVINWSSWFKLVSNFQCLRVLDLSGLKIKELPKSIGELICLRFLKLSNTNVVKLPHSVTRLLNLQSLYLDECEEFQELPNDISKLVNLRHLKLKCFNPKLTYMPSGLGNLTDIRTLGLFIVSESLTKHVGKLGDLNNLNNIEGILRIMVNRESKDVVSEAEAANLKMKKRLRRLSVEFKYGTKEDEMVLNGLLPPIDLKELRIRGFRGERFPYWMMDELESHLPNLVRIELVECKSCINICSMGRLLNLEYLVLAGLSNVEYIENDVTDTHDELVYTPLFPSLVELSIHDMPKLKGWRRILSRGDQIDNQHHLIDLKPAFPRLKFLEVSNVELAATITGPPLTGFTSLKLIRVYNDSNGYIAHHPPQKLILRSNAIPNLKSLKFWQCYVLEVLPEVIRGLSFLEELEIQNCKELKEIPEWIDSLTSLNTLTLTRCPKLEYLPYQITHLASLRKLTIWSSPILAKKCQEPSGEYWPYIKHIPELCMNMNHPPRT